MKSEKIKDIIRCCSGIFAFEYEGADGNVDPYYIPETKSYEYLLYYNGNEKTVYDIDTVMSTPFINGKSLSQLAEKITVTEY